MTPEAAEYHRLMLIVGLSDRFDQEFDQALEEENPLSEPILALTSCISNVDKACSVLHNYALDNDFDEGKVCELILQDLHGRFFSGELSRMQTAEIIRTITACLNHWRDEPWGLFYSLTYALEEYEDDVIAEDEFNRIFDTWFFRGEPTQYLHPQILATKEKTHHSKAYWKNLAATIAMVFLSFATIGITVALTGARDIGEFTKQDRTGFCCFIVSELLTLGLCLFFANRCGKRLHDLSEAELSMLAAHKNDGLDLLPYPCTQVLFETGGVHRALIQSWNNRYCVSIDRFLFSTQLWVPTAFQSNLEAMNDVEDFLHDENFHLDSLL